MDRQPFPECLESNRIILNVHETSLAGTMFRCVDEDRERLRAFLAWVDGTKTVDDTLAYILRAHEGRANGTLADYGLFERESGVYMGNVGMHAIQWDHACIEFGYWLLGRFEGRGFMSEAVRLLEQTCFEMGFHRIEIRCNSNNVRSASVPRRLGYTLDGTLRENAIEHGQFRDTLVFGKLNPAQ